MTDRYREITRRVNDRYQVTGGDQWAGRHDAAYLADLRRVHTLIIATDTAMGAEGIIEEVRDRVMFRLLYSEPPAGIEAPDWREAANRAVDRDLAIQQASLSPLLPPDVEHPHS